MSEQTTEPTQPQAAAAVQTPRQKVEAHIINLRQQHEDFLQKRQRAQTQLEQVVIALAGLEGAITAYEDALNYMPDAPPVPPDAPPVPPDAPPAEWREGEVEPDALSRG